MTDDEVRAELVAWGEYNAKTGLDVSLARYREIAAALRAGVEMIAELSLEPAQQTEPIQVFVHSPEGAAAAGIEFAQARKGKRK